MRRVRKFPLPMASCPAIPPTGCSIVNGEGGYEPTDPPKGLPDAKCGKRLEQLGRVDVCYVLNGRYIGLAQDLDKTERVHQKISAQALILEKADQNA